MNWEVCQAPNHYQQWEHCPVSAVLRVSLMLALASQTSVYFNPLQISEMSGSQKD